MAYSIGVDLGQSADYSTMSVIRGVGEGGLHVVHLERLPLGTSYVEVGARVVRLVGDTRLRVGGRLPTLAIDKTGVGSPVADMLLDRGLAFYAVTIIATGKAKVHAVEGGRVSVRLSKGELIEAFAAPLRAGRLKVAPNLRFGPALAEEFSTFRRKQNERTGHVRFEHERATDKDDLILACSLACWAASQRPS